MRSGQTSIGLCSCSQSASRRRFQQAMGRPRTPFASQRACQRALVPLTPVETLCHRGPRATVPQRAHGLRPLHNPRRGGGAGGDGAQGVQCCVGQGMPVVRYRAAIRLRRIGVGRRHPRPPRGSGDPQQRQRAELAAASHEHRSGVRSGREGREIAGRPRRRRHLS